MSALQRSRVVSNDRETLVLDIILIHPDARFGPENAINPGSWFLLNILWELDRRNSVGCRAFAGFAGFGDFLTKHEEAMFDEALEADFGNDALNYLLRRIEVMEVENYPWSDVLKPGLTPEEQQDIFQDISRLPRARVRMAFMPGFTLPELIPGTEVELGFDAVT